MVEFITGAAGSGKSVKMIQKINSIAEQDRDIFIIVPEQFSHDFDKKLYRSIGAKKFNSLSSFSFKGTARQIFQLFGDTKRSGEYADETARMILIYQALENVKKNPQSNRFFEKQTLGSGFPEAALKMIGDMKQSGITPQLLMTKSALLDKKLMDKTNDMALIYLEYEKLMEKYGFKDNLDDIKEAAEAANLHRFFKGKSVFFDEFESFTGDQLEFIRVVISMANDVYIALRTDDPDAGEFTLFETVNNTCREIKTICRDLNKPFRNIMCSGSYRFKNPDIAFLSSHIMRNHRPDKSESVPAPDNIRIFESKDYYSECEYVCASIKRLIYSDKTLRYRDIAVISNNITDYAEVLEAAFERYEIPYFLSIEKPVTHTALMIFFGSLLDIVSRRSFSTELLLRYAKCGILDISLQEAAALENYCYKWGIDGNVWEERFNAPDDRLEELENIRFNFIEPLKKLIGDMQTEKSASGLCRIIYEYVVKCGAEKNVSRIMSSLIKDNKVYAASELKRLWGCLIDILDGIAGTLGDTEISATELKRIVRSLMSQIKYSVPPQTLDSVTAASARTARLNEPRVVFIMGANDGSFPNTVNIHGIFSEHEKQQLEENGIQISRRLPDIIASERLVVYKSLSAASEKLFISYSLSDLSGLSRYPAPVIDSVSELFGIRSMIIAEEQLEPDFYAVTMQSAFYRYMQDRKQNTPSTASIKKILTDNMDYNRRLRYVAERSADRGVYRISREMAASLRKFDPFFISPTSFEMYNKCHFQYFCREFLRLYGREKVDLNASFSGSIIHRCFFSIISSRDKESFISMSPDELSAEISKAADVYLNEEMGGSFAKPPRFELNFRKLSERLVTVFLHTQQELMASGFTPKKFEINLNDRHYGKPLVLPFGDGKRLSFGGIIDRADTWEADGKKYVRIIDYKSGHKDIDAELLSCGINMQMLLYLFAVTQDDSLFAGYEPAGALYSPVKVSVKTDDGRIDSPNTEAVSDSLRATGLVLGDMNVLEAMEHKIQNNFVPVQLDKNGEIDAKKSSCITKAAFEELKQFTFRKLAEMAESVFNGDADASPLYFGERNYPCLYCDYVNICGSSSAKNFRNAKKTDTTEAEDILSRKTEQEED